MDNGGWKVIYDNKPYLICDETEYFAVYREYKQIAAFKTKDLAFEYVFLKQYERGIYE